MTKEFIITVNKALAAVAIGCGGVGMALTVPYLCLSDWFIVGVAGVVFLSGAVLYGSGAVSMALLIKYIEK